MAPKLNQILGVEKGTKARVYNELTQVDKQLAKGDLLVASAADAYARLAIGAANRVLTSGASSATSWATIVDAMIDAAAAISISKLAGYPTDATKFLRGDGSWAAAGSPSLTAALPTSPSNGDEIIFVDSLSAPTYAWHLRYISAKASNKWQFVGGPPMSNEVAAAESTTSTAYVALTTPGPSIAVPVAGDYFVTLGAFITGPAAGALPIMSYDIGGTAAADADGISVVSSGVKVNSSRVKKKAALTAVTLTSKYKTASGTGTWQDRFMNLLPIAIGG